MSETAAVKININPPAVSSPSDHFVQRAAVNQTPSHQAPSIVSEVLRAPGQPLDSSTRAFMEPRFGQDLSRIPTHAPQPTPRRLSIGQPHSPFENEAELTSKRVMEVPAKSAGGQADFSGVRIHTGEQAEESARSVNALAYTVGRQIVFGEGQYEPGTSTGRQLLAHELAHVQQGTSGEILHRQVASQAGTSAGKKKSFKLKIPPGTKTAQEFRRYAETIIFGRVLNLSWSATGDLQTIYQNVSQHIGQEVTFTFSAALVASQGTPSAKEKAAKEAEATADYATLNEDERLEMNTEIDRRYYQSINDQSGNKIKRGQTGKIAIWNSLKQEVLADRKKLNQLSDTVKSLLGESNFTPENYQTLVQLGEVLSQLSDAELKAFFVAGPNGTAITPSDYPKLLGIARKIANLSPEARQDYLGRVNTSTTSLNEMETSIDNYLQLRAEREKQVQQHEETTKPLLGTEDLYTIYRNYKEVTRTLAMAKAMKGAAKDKTQAEEAIDFHQDRFNKTEAALLIALKHKDFDSIAAFEKAMESFRIAFRAQAVNLALDVLARYDHMLFEARKKLQQPGVAAAIVQGISTTKASEYYKEYHEQEGIASNLQIAHEPKETWWIKPYNQAKSAAASAKVSAEAAVLRGAGDHPLIKDRGIDLEKLVDADAAGVQSYLMEEINDREENARTARQEFRDDPDRIFKLPDLVAATYQMLSAGPDTIYGRIISDYIKDEAAKHLLSSIAKTVLAVALAFLVPGGGWLAAAALVASAGLSGYEAYQAYKEYQEQERDYELGFLSEEPSLFWVGLAIAGAALDIGVAASVLVKQSATALKSLKGPMLDFAKNGERELPTLLAKIEAAEGLNTKFKAALAREAEASFAAQKAFKELGTMGARLGAFAGGVDPGIVVQAFRALYYSIKRGINSIVKLSADAKFLEIAGDLTKMSGAERAQLEVAFEEVKNLVKIGTGKGMDESSLVNFVDRLALNRGKTGFQTKLLDEMNAWKPLTAEQTKALDALKTQRGTVRSLYERKAAAQEELSVLRAKPDKSSEDIAEIRELEKELNDLDPKALPDKRPAKGIGKIAEAEMKLEQVEKEAAKAQLSLYERMRDAKPPLAAKERALKAPHVEDIAGPLKTKPGPKDVDHIVSVREVADMDGFADLPLKEQKDIVNMQENLIGMDMAANRSKGERTWKSWSQASNFYGQATIDAMAKRQADVRALIEAEIKNRLAKLATKP